MHRVMLPSWVVSVILHAALVVVLGLSWRFAPVGAASAPIREVGVVLKRVESTGEVDYEGEKESQERQAEAMTAAVASLPSEASPPVDPSTAFPGPADIIGPGMLEPGESLSANQLTEGPAPSPDLSGGKARTRVFGIEGEGYHFVYVFDRSGSMGGAEPSPLNAAKKELLASLDSLGSTHQFRIIFYNDKSRIFPKPGRLILADAKNKLAARRYVDSITGDGGTAHQPALMQALRLGPDVIFFLTDAEEPALSHAQLVQVRRSNVSQAAIHTIQFGHGPRPQRDNFLMQLARMNGGKYVYIDVSRLGRFR